MPGPVESTGALAVLGTLTDGGVHICFTNPGTSEMHLAAGLDAVPRMRAVLCLFEGVATGAADGYGRMADRPAATLLHLGPGLGNGLANLHNARRAGTSVVNLVGDHATYHKSFDAPLESDIEAVAGSVSAWVRRATSAAGVGMDTAEAIAAAGSGPEAPGAVSTLILPADVCWSRGGTVTTVPRRHSPAIDADAVSAAAELLRGGGPGTLLLGGRVLRRRGLEAASRVAAATGAALWAETSPARMERGAGLPRVNRLPYVGEVAAARLATARYLVLAGAGSPVSFFAYPGKPSDLVPKGCVLVDIGDTAEALEQLADLVAPDRSPRCASPARPHRPQGELTAAKAAAVIGALLPEGTIVVDEAITSGRWLPEATAGCPPHDWLTVTGGAVGEGMPLAVGAAIACPERPVINLEADGSAMYTPQALWTQAQHGLDVTTVVLNNAGYAILDIELRRLGAPHGAAAGLFKLAGLDFVALAEGQGVPATRARTADELAAQLAKALAEPGPHLIEAIVPAVTSLID